MHTSAHTDTSGLRINYKHPSIHCCPLTYIHTQKLILTHRSFTLTHRHTLMVIHLQSLFIHNQTLTYTPSCLLICIHHSCTPTHRNNHPQAHPIHYYTHTDTHDNPHDPSNHSHTQRAPSTTSTTLPRSLKDKWPPLLL